MKFLLHGDRLHGTYLLARMKEEPNWLLRKLDDAISPDRVVYPADGTTILYLRNTRGIISLAQVGAIEFHPWDSRMPHPEKPDQLIWDLNPDPAVPWPQVLGAAFLIRDFLAGHGLHALVKTS